MEEKNPTMHKADGIALKDYVDVRFEAVCKEIAATEKVRDLQAVGFKEQIGFLNDAIAECRDFISKHHGKASQNQILVAYALALISLVVSIILRLAK